MIWSHNGKAIWYRTSDALPIQLPLQELPAPQSLAGKLFAGKPTSTSAQIDPHLWCNPPDAERIHTLSEESLHLRSYNAVLTLLWATRMEEPTPEEEGLQELTPEDFTLNRRRWPR